MLTVTIPPIKVQRSPAGTDYVVFMCPCGRRNKQSLYEAVYKTEGLRAVAFKCKACGKTCEVARPIGQLDLIVTPEQFAARRAARSR